MIIILATEGCVELILFQFGYGMYNALRVWQIEDKFRIIRSIVCIYFSSKRGFGETRLLSEGITEVLECPELVITCK